MIIEMGVLQNISSHTFLRTEKRKSSLMGQRTRWAWDTILINRYWVNYDVGNIKTIVMKKKVLHQFFFIIILK